MEKLTKTLIEQMAKEVMDYLIENELSHDVCIYYNNKKMKNDYDWHNDDAPANIVIQEGYDPHDYFEWAAHNHILSMSFEGPLYQAINYGTYDIEGLDHIFNKYGVYYELGNMWNLTAYPINDDMEIEYTVYEEPKEVKDIYLWDKDGAPVELQVIMQKWYELSARVGDIGSCVVGAGFKFEWNGDEYFMSACSPYQGSISWENPKDEIKRMLEDIGATNISYNWGSMD